MTVRCISKTRWVIMLAVVMLLLAHLIECQRRGGGRRRKGPKGRKGIKGITVYKSKASKEYYNNPNVSELSCPDQVILTLSCFYEPI